MSKHVERIGQVMTALNTVSKMLLLVEIGLLLALLLLIQSKAISV